jgi:hypothetical protein
MKNIKSNFYFALILLTNILVYFFKIDRDFFASEEYLHHPHQTYSEQLISKDVFHFENINLSVLSPFLNTLEPKGTCIDYANVWRSINLVYNSHVHHLLTQQELCISPTARIVSFLHKQCVSHISSKDEEPSYHFMV